ncbi:polysaccharide deacetylase [Nakamurella antarctica]|uniref:Polysaccharide deacetylase n=1 Tax=Nakamurella antarctica TaxID=1902245 RepID=A0A3G8ZQC8_9ACTN|nr:polysaccharide deacetylase [Nakamurella antarctica]
MAVAVAFALAVTTGILISQSSREPEAVAASDLSTDPVSLAADESLAEQPSGAAVPVAGARKATNIPMTKLAPGDKAPQFIIFSFDGVGSHTKLVDFMAAAAPTNSRFVGFLTGLYLLEDSKGGLYHAPGADPGSSDVGFGGNTAEVLTRVDDLNTFYLGGNEVGSHYNGHFCGLGANWSTAEWNDELDQFYSIVANWQSMNEIPNAPALAFTGADIKGGRTPCLAGKFDQLTPSWKAHNMTYDSSGENEFSGMAWPEQRDGIWQFPIPTIYSQAYVDAGWGNGMVKAMDYNFWYKFNDATDDPASAAQLTPMVLSTYEYMYQRAFEGNRAPIIVANHFNDWNGNSFNPATLQFMTQACGQPETYCATYQDVIAWMELQDPDVLSGLQEQRPVADSASS